MEVETIKIIALLVGIILGGLTVLTTLGVSIRNKNFTTNGLGFCVIGVLLVGMSIWTSIKIELPGGIIVDLEKQIQESERIIASIKEEKASLTVQVQELETAVNQIRPTARDAERFNNIRTTISNIKDRNATIESKLKNLESNTKTSRLDLERLKKTTKIKPK